MNYSTPLVFTPKMYSGVKLPPLPEPTGYSAMWATTNIFLGTGNSHLEVKFLDIDDPNEYNILNEIDYVCRKETNGRLTWIQIPESTEFSLDHYNGASLVKWLADDLLICGFSAPGNIKRYYFTTDFINYTQFPAYFGDIFAINFSLLPDGRIMVTGENQSGTDGHSDYKHYWISSLDRLSWTTYTITDYPDTWGPMVEFDGKVYIIVYLVFSTPIILSCTDPTLNVWNVEINDIPQTINWASGFHSTENRLWIVGGNGSQTIMRYKNKGSNDWNIIPSITEVDPGSSDKWIGNIYAERETVFRLSGNTLYFYNLDTNYWSSMPLDKGLDRQINEFWFDYTWLLDNEILIAFNEETKFMIKHKIDENKITNLTPP